MKLEYDKLEAALDLAKRQRAGGTEYTMSAVTIGDMEELIKRARIVDELAALDPLSESKFGISFCMFCDASENIEDDHMRSCVWRRAKESTT